LGETSDWIALDVLPPFVIDATLTQDDPDFLAASGFNLTETVGRLWQTWLDEPPPPDPSITGRLVRNTLAPLPGTAADLTTVRTREIALIAESQRRYPPETLLAWYLNTNYYGSDAYGLEAAAQIYLDKRAVDLTLDEAALLAAIAATPDDNPFENPQAALDRRNRLLRQMFDRGLIDTTAYQLAISAPLNLDPGDRYQPAVAPAFVAYAQAQAETLLDAQGRDGTALVARGGLRIETTLDLDLYHEAECLLARHIARLQRGDAQSPTDPCQSVAYLPTAAISTTAATAPDVGTVAIIDAQTGEIRALVGAATAPVYQPGPTLYPFVYLEGFRGGPEGFITPATMLLDIPQQFPGSEEGLIFPFDNLDGRFLGPVSVREALANWRLPPTAEVANTYSMNAIVRIAHELGINSLTRGNYTLTLLERGGEVALLDVAYAYAVFAALGDMRGLRIEPLAFGFRNRDPVAVRQIADADGTILWQYDPGGAANCAADFCTPKLDPSLAYLVNDILADQPERWALLGEANPLDLSRRGAVVNGVTADRVENWAVGYTPQLVVGVHLGRADGAALGFDAYALDGAASVWRALMEYAHTRDALPETDWPRPLSIVPITVCERSGLLPNTICPIYEEIVPDGRQPSAVDDYWEDFDINRRTGQLATANTPSQDRRTARFFVPPAEALAWWRETGLPLPPTDFDTFSRPQQSDSLQILRPQPLDSVGGVVEIFGIIETSGLEFYQVAYGADLDPDEWIDLSGQRATFTPNGNLASWDTAALDDGVYSLRVRAVRVGGQVETEVIQVQVDNTPPTISLTTADTEQVYRWPGTDELVLTAEVGDNLRIDRVEFYRNGDLLGVDATEPFGFPWRIDGPGTETFSAVAFDAVGNQANDQLTIDILRAGA
ncbi:MAG: hypothetical protein GYB67_18840, partial [Chloroflexi bacterium]|nr:hypothetical protein [Chloroflexota bacterium]